MLLLFQACNLLFRQNQAKLSYFSATSIDESIKLLHSFIPSEFNRKMRPLPEICYWKATELRLFMLYAGVVVLKSRHILSKRKYLTFLKFSTAMRMLLSPNSSDEDMAFCSKLLVEFCSESHLQYGNGFMTCNVHSVIHLVDGYKRYGPLDFVSSFPFESYLGLLKSYVQSGYKPLQQVSFRVFHENKNVVKTSQLKCGDMGYCEFFGCVEVLNNLVDFGSDNVLHYCKAKLLNGCVINIASAADSTSFFKVCVAKVFDLVKCDGLKYLIVKKYKSAKIFFLVP